MTITQSGLIPGPVGGKHAFDDLSHFSDGSTWADIGGNVVLEFRPSPNWSHKGLDPGSGRAEAARRILAREGVGTTVGS